MVGLKKYILTVPYCKLSKLQMYINITIETIADSN